MIGTIAMINVKSLYKSFSLTHPILKNVTLDLKEGDLKAIIGPSGCGKSTLLRCLNGLDKMDSGEITISGITLKRSSGDHFSVKEYDLKTQAIRKNVGMVFQSFNLFPHKNILENIMLAPTVVQKTSKLKAMENAHALLHKVGCEELAERYPHQISGGQSQRVAIARALALQPKIMLYDEPTSALDPELVDEVLDVVKKLDQEGMTQLVVTHEMHFAKNVADEVIFMEKGEVIEKGPPDILFKNPQHEKTKKFLKRFL